MKHLLKITAIIMLAVAALLCGCTVIEEPVLGYEEQYTVDAYNNIRIFGMRLKTSDVAFIDDGMHNAINAALAQAEVSLSDDELFYVSELRYAIRLNIATEGKEGCAEYCRFMSQSGYDFTDLIPAYALDVIKARITGYQPVNMQNIRMKIILAEANG